MVRYAANTDYFDGKPGVDALVFAITPDANVRLQKVRQNECQIALSPKPLDVQAASTDPKLTVVKNAAFMTAFVAINSQHPPLDKPEVRQAINLAFDKDVYLKAVFEALQWPPTAFTRLTPGATPRTCRGTPTTPLKPASYWPKPG